MVYKYDLTIVIPTLGRAKEVNALLDSIYASNIDSKYKVEILIVDQNFSDLLDNIVAKSANKAYPITQYKVSFRGLSKAKNFGTAKSQGRFICFVDDDAEFLDGTVNLALQELESGMFDIISGRCIDREGLDSVCHFSNDEAILSIDDFEGKFIESTMFFKSEICKKYPYDEEMGVGCFYGAEEGYDLIYRMLTDQIRIKFSPDIKFYHPQTVATKVGKAMIRRAFTYRCGYGRLCKKHGLKTKYYKRIVCLIGYLFILPFYRPKDFKFYFADLLGSVVGYNL